MNWFLKIILCAIFAINLCSCGAITQKKISTIESDSIQRNQETEMSNGESSEPLEVEPKFSYDSLCTAFSGKTVLKDFLKTHQV